MDKALSHIRHLPYLFSFALIIEIVLQISGEHRSSYLRRSGLQDAK